LFIVRVLFQLKRIIENSFCGSTHWRQPRRGCRGHIPTNILVGGDVNGNIPTNMFTYFRIQQTNISRCVFASLKQISFGKDAALPPIRFSHAGGQWIHKNVAVSALISARRPARGQMGW